MKRREVKNTVALQFFFGALSLGLVLAPPAFASRLRGAVWQDMTYAGRCGVFLLSPNGQRVFYRYDLRRWTYGDERDFSCFIVDN